ncbi:NADPH-dependent F420 reductase [Rhizobium ruizarguesonis]
MKYSIIGTGSVGITLAGLFGKNSIPVAVANTRGPSTVASSIKGLGDSVRPSTVEEALDADIVFVAVQFLNFKDVGKLRSDWSGKVVVDVTNSAFLPAEVQERELNGRLSSEVNADRVPGAKLVKAFNQLPMQGLTAPVPAGGRRVVFISSDHAEASAAVASLTENLGFAPIEVGRIAEGGRLIQARNALVFQNLIKF